MYCRVVRLDRWRFIPPAQESDHIFHTLRSSWNSTGFISALSSINSSTNTMTPEEQKARFRVHAHIIHIHTTQAGLKFRRSLSSCYGTDHPRVSHTRDATGTCGGWCIETASVNFWYNYVFWCTLCRDYYKYVFHSAPFISFFFTLVKQHSPFRGPLRDALPTLLLTMNAIVQQRRDQTRCCRCVQPVCSLF